MARTYTMATCRKCHQEYRSNGQSSMCQYCHRKVSWPDRSAELVAPHRCKQCGKKIITRECLGCLTLRKIESAKKEPVEVSEPSLVALDR